MAELAQVVDLVQEMKKETHTFAHVGRYGFRGNRARAVAVDGCRTALAGNKNTPEIKCLHKV